jgi:dihydroxyacetone kinase-like predicted kinase
MTIGLSNVVTCEITNAVRDAEMDGIDVRAGQWIGLINDELAVTADTILDTASRLLERADTRSYERVTLYYGADVNEEDALLLAETLAAQFGQQEFEVLYGGQALYPYLISIE